MGVVLAFLCSLCLLYTNNLVIHAKWFLVDTKDNKHYLVQTGNTPSNNDVGFELGAHTKHDKASADEVPVDGSTKKAIVDEIKDNGIKSKKEGGVNEPQNDLDSDDKKDGVSVDGSTDNVIADEIKENLIKSGKEISTNEPVDKDVKLDNDDKEEEDATEMTGVEDGSDYSDDDSGTSEHIDTIKAKHEYETGIDYMNSDEQDYIVPG